MLRISALLAVLATLLGLAPAAGAQCTPPIPGELHAGTHAFDVNGGRGNATKTIHPPERIEGGWRYSVSESVPGVGFVFEQNDGLPGPGEESGWLRLRGLDLPRSDGSTLQLRPSLPSTLFGFTAVAWEPTGLPAPADTVPMVYEVGYELGLGREVALVICGTEIDARAVNWRVSVRGGADFELFGTVWLTQEYGGMFVRDERTILSDDFVSGNFELQLSALS